MLITREKKRHLMHHVASRRILSSRSLWVVVVMLAVAPFAALGVARGDDNPAALDALPSMNSDERLAFLRQMAGKGLRTPEAVPMLVRLLFGEVAPDDARVRSRAGEELVAIGGSAVPPLLSRFPAEPVVPLLGRIRPAPIAEMLNRLRSSDAASNAASRLAAVQVLAVIGPDAEDAASPLAEIIRNGQEPQDLRLEALRTLGQIGSGAKVAVRYLALLLAEDPNSEIRSFAARALGSMGINAREELKTLIGALKDVSPAVRQEAAVVLQRLGLDAWSAVPALVDMFRNHIDQPTRQAALRAIIVIDPAAGSSTIAQGIREVEDGARLPLLDHLSRYAGPLGDRWDDELMVAIIATLTDEQAPVRAKAAELINQFPKVPRMVDALLAALGDGNADVRRLAAQGLGNVQADADRIVPALLETARDRTTSVRSASLVALSKVGRQDPVVEARLIEAIQSDLSDDVRHAILNAVGPYLASSAMKGKTPLGPLVADIVLRPDESESIRTAAASALLSSHGADRSRVSGLLEIANSEAKLSAPFLQAVLSALRPFAKSDPRVVSAAIRLADQSNPQIAAVAFGLLAETSDTDYASALPRILDGMNASSPTVQTAAAGALRFRPNAPVPPEVREGILRFLNHDLLAPRRAAVQFLASASPNADQVALLIPKFADPDPAIQSTLNDWLGRWMSARVAGMSAVGDVLLKHKASENASVRLASVILLASIGHFDTASYDILSAAVSGNGENPSKLVLTAAALAVSRGEVRALPLLVNGLASPNSETRQVTLSVLSGHPHLFGGQSDRNHINSIVANLSGRLDLEYRRKLTRNLMNSKYIEKSLEDRVRSLLRSEDGAVRNAALQLCLSLEYYSNNFLKDVIEFSDERQPDTRRQVLQFLVYWPDDPRTIDLILRGMTDPDPDIRAESTNLAYQGTERFDQYVQALVERLSDSSPNVVERAAMRLEAIAPPFDSIDEALTSAWNRAENRTRAVLFRTFAATGAPADRLAGILAKGLNSKDGNLLSSILGNYWTQKHISPSVILDLLRLMESEQSAVRQQAIFALGVLGPSAREALPALMRSLADDDLFLQTAAVTAIGAIETDDEAAARLALPYVSSSFPYLQAAALEVLARHPAAVRDAGNWLWRFVNNPAHPGWLPAIQLAIATGMEQADLVDPIHTALRRNSGTSALDALAMLNDMTPDLIDEVVRLLTHQNSGIRVRAITTLNQIAAKALASGNQTLTDSLANALAEAKRAAVLSPQHLPGIRILDALVSTLHQSDWRRAFISQMKIEIERYSAFVIISSIYVIYIIVCFFIALVYPPAYIVLGGFGGWVRDIQISVGNSHSWKLPLRKLLGVGFLDWHDEVAQAWTVRYYRSVRLFGPPKPAIWAIKLSLRRA